MQGLPYLEHPSYSVFLGLPNHSGYEKKESKGWHFKNHLYIVISYLMINMLIELYSPVFDLELMVN